MCFIIHVDHQKPKIATRNIRCYKSANRVIKNHGKKYYEPLHYYDNTFRFGVTHRAKLGIWSTTIYEGFHSYSDSTGELRWYKKPNRLICIIPKGATYYYNPARKQYVSNRIIIRSNF